VAVLEEADTLPEVLVVATELLELTELPAIVAAAALAARLVITLVAADSLLGWQQERGWAARHNGEIKLTQSQSVFLPLAL
jgi:hypothetical protein